MDEYLGLGSCEVLHIAYLYLSLLVGLQYAVDKGAGLTGGACGLAVGYLGDGQCLAVALLYLGTHAHSPSALSVIVLAHVDTAACGEVGIEMELLPMQVGDGCIAYLSQVVGQYLAVQTHSDAFGTLRKQERELHRQGDRFLVAPVIRQLPLGGLGVEDNIQSEVAQTGLDVSASRRIVSCDDVTPVALAIHQQILLPQLHQRILDAGITVGMELHGMAHDVGHLVVAAVIHALHAVHDASLHGLESVAYVRHCTLQDYV